MKKNQSKKNPVRVLKFLATIVFGLLFPPLLLADVVVLQNGQVIPGTVLQRDDSGVLVQTEYGSFRYPDSLIKEVKQEANTVHHLTKDGQPIPDWSQIVVMLATNGWADHIQQVPATVINYGKYNHVPYIAFRCAAGGYELDIFGDLDNPAAVQIGALTYLKDNPAARTNCINYLCALLPNAKVRAAVRALDLSQKQLDLMGNMTLETLLPGEWGSYGGWWVSVYDLNQLAKAQASNEELQALTQSPAATSQTQPPPQAAAAQPEPATTGTAPDSASQPPTDGTAQPTTTTTYGYPYGYYGYGWTSAELANAHPAATSAAATTPGTHPEAAAAATPPATSGNNVYPRSYTRQGGNYNQSQARRR